MAYTHKSKEEKAEEVKKLLENAENKIETYFENPESIKEYLSFMSKFYNYSFRNSILIENQFKGAMAVGSYAFWKKQGYPVNKGEKGIKILVPTKGKSMFENSKNEIKTIDKATPEEKKAIKEGKIKVYEGRTYFVQGYVFDIAQTNAKAKDLPKLFPNKWLDGKVENYNTLRKGMNKIANEIGIKIVKPYNELGNVKGVSYTDLKEVALNPRNSELQNVKTLIHELTHAKLHTKERSEQYKKFEKEFQAELTAYTVCSYFGIDTSEYSLKYIHDWTKDKTLNEKEDLLKEVHETSTHYISVLEETLINEKQINKDMDINNSISHDVEFDSVEKALSKDPEALKAYREMKAKDEFTINVPKKDMEIDL